MDQKPEPTIRIKVKKTAEDVSNDVFVNIRKKEDIGNAIAVIMADTPTPGTFQVGETVTGGTTNTDAEVKSWDAATRTLQVFNRTGRFSSGETITGQTSGAVATTESYNTINMRVTEEENPKPFTANLQYEDPNFYFTKGMTRYEFPQNYVKTRVLFPQHILQGQQIDSSEKQYETLTVTCNRSHQKTMAGNTKKNVPVELRVYTQSESENRINGTNAVIVDTRLNYLYFFEDLDPLKITNQLLELKAGQYIYMFHDTNAKKIINQLQLRVPAKTFCVRCAIQP